MILYYHTWVIIMRAEERTIARRKLDKKLISLRNHNDFSVPLRGWLRAIREALGLTSTQLAKRMGVVQSRAVTIEQAEARGTITLNTLEKAAQAMDCRLVYAIVPRTSLEDMVEHQSRQKALKMLKQASHSMALEDQAVGSEEEAELIKRLEKKLIEKAGSSLWDDV